MIEAEKLTIRYGPVTAVDGLTFTARPGHVTGFPAPMAQEARSRSG
jgi:ABC-2 type transport system ATP-binding protein